jgi:hypothetical protein
MYETTAANMAGGRYASAPRMGGRHHHNNNVEASAAAVRSITPSGRGNATLQQQQTAPPAGGLIRLTLKKPMGIVFEPTYDPNNKAQQRGVRICDLPRTGAAALSRQLQVGDELLQINNTVVSRLVFDEIMELIIEADPDAVHLLFRRPKKELLAGLGLPGSGGGSGRGGTGIGLKKDNSSTVKWVDEEESNLNSNANNSSSAPPSSSANKKKKKKKAAVSSPKNKSKSTTTAAAVDADNDEEEDETLQSKESTLETADDYTGKNNNNSKRKNSSSGGGKKSISSSNKMKSPYETESFLDMLIDAVCSEHTCRDAGRGGRDDFSDDDSETYATYEENTTANTNTNKDAKGSNNNKKAATATSNNNNSKKYEDDGTLESVDTNDRPLTLPLSAQLAPLPPAAMSSSPILTQQHQAQHQQQPVIVADDLTDEGNGIPAPIQELEYNDDIGADVSVMDSIGGPSLLLEQRKNAWKLQNGQSTSANQSLQQIVPDEILQNFGLDWTLPGLNRLDSIRTDPTAYYSHVVRKLLQENEPEKVRLLDKLLSKYKGREDHLVQKLSVRYNERSPDHHNNHDSKEVVHQQQNVSINNDNKTTTMMMTTTMKTSRMSPSQSNYKKRTTRNRHQGKASNNNNNNCPSNNNNNNCPSNHISSITIIINPAKIYPPTNRPSIQKTIPKMTTMIPSMALRPPSLPKFRNCSITCMAKHPSRVKLIASVPLCARTKVGKRSYWNSSKPKLSSRPIRKRKIPVPPTIICPAFCAIVNCTTSIMI